VRTVHVSVAVAFAILISSNVGEAQAPNAIKGFRATPVSVSAPCVNPLLGCSPVADRIVFDEAVLTLSCGARPSAVLSSTPDGRGSLVIDNFIEVNGRNACVGGVTAPDGVVKCYSSLSPLVTFGMRALDLFQPVPPLNVSGEMPRGQGIVTFSLVDYGGVYGNSDIWLVSDCIAHQNQKAAICHKPGTPAEKALTVGTAAISGHLRHGDTLDLSFCHR
jgi:hypothetical protein